MTTSLSDGPSEGPAGSRQLSAPLTPAPSARPPPRQSPSSASPGPRPAHSARSGAPAAPRTHHGLHLSSAHLLNSCSLSTVHATHRYKRAGSGCEAACGHPLAMTAASLTESERLGAQLSSPDASRGTQQRSVSQKRRRAWMFSPMAATAALMCSATLLPVSLKKGCSSSARSLAILATRPSTILPLPRRVPACSGHAGDVGRGRQHQCQPLNLGHGRVM